jgi:hypothetical protein
VLVSTREFVKVSLYLEAELKSGDFDESFSFCLIGELNEF